MKFRLLLLAVFMTLGNFLPLITPQILRFFIDTATDNLEASRDVLRRFLLPLSEWIGSDPLITAAFFFIAVSIAGQLIPVSYTHLTLPTKA